MAESACPFFRRQVFYDEEQDFAVLAIAPTKDACALMIASSGPCILAIAGEEVSWLACIRNPVNNGSSFDTEFGRKFEALGFVQPAAREPDTPETVAEKARQAIEIGNRFADLRRADPTPVVERIGGDKR
jgi:hypothetical protein